MLLSTSVSVVDSMTGSKVDDILLFTALKFVYDINLLQNDINTVTSAVHNLAAKLLGLF